MLRVLENQELRRVGGTRRIPLDVRIIAATHRDLWHMESRGLFRQDLCYRLHIFPIEIPPLCDRPADIPVLVDYFYRLYIRKSSLESPPALSYRTIRQLVNRPWPGMCANCAMRWSEHYCLAWLRNLQKYALRKTNPTCAIPQPQHQLRRKSFRKHCAHHRAASKAGMALRHCWVFTLLLCGTA